MKETERHLISQDVRVSRRYSPLYSLGGRRYDPEPIPPVHVEISASFDDNDAAMTFEAKVREILENA